MTPSYAASLWAAITPDLAPAPGLRGEVRADVAIVGAGILGLSIALHLAEAGVRAVVIDAAQIGFGASGRNTGFVVPHLVAGHDLTSVTALLGAEHAERLVQLAGESGDVVFETIGRFAIAADAEQTGWLQPAHRQAKLALLERRVAIAQARGHPVVLLGRAETERLTGTRRYLGALLDRSGGQLNPLAYVRGLARAATRAGATIFGDSPVLRHRREAGAWVLDAAQGSVRAARIFFTTNALVGSLLPNVKSSLIAVQPYQVATQPLDPATLARILPERQPVADLHRHTFAYRLSPDNRLVSGGIAMRNDAGAVQRMAEYFIRRLHRYLPGLPALQAEYAWRGVVATTRDFLPVVWQIEPGLLAPIGCNGRGVAMSTALGRALAAHVATGAPSPLPLVATQPRPLHRLLQFAPSGWLAWNRWRDWRDDRQGVS